MCRWNIGQVCWQREVLGVNELAVVPDSAGAEQRQLGKGWEKVGPAEVHSPGA